MMLDSERRLGCVRVWKVSTEKWCVEKGFLRVFAPCHGQRGVATHTLDRDTST